jgi:hypothetical protein
MWQYQCLVQNPHGPSWNWARDFRREMSANKRVISKRNSPHARRDNGDSSSYGLSWGWTWVSTGRNRPNYDTGESFKESSDKQHTESVNGKTGLYLSGIFYVQSFSHLFPSTILTSHAVWTPQPCGSRHKNLNKTPTEIWTLVSEL